MRIRSVAKLLQLIAQGSILWLATGPLAQTQEEPSEAATNLDVDVYDEIIVQGEPTLRLLREDVYKAEENFYDLFNSLNEGRRFDIHCFYRTWRRTQVRRRYCEANFVKSEYRPPEVQGGAAYGAWVRYQTRKMYEMMAALMEEHPELQAALLEFGDAKQTLASAVSDRCANSPMTCRK